eukprot:3448293-Pleurochrysis_carterae.AAC.3
MLTRLFRSWCKRPYHLLDCALIDGTGGGELCALDQCGCICCGCREAEDEGGEGVAAITAGTAAVRAPPHDLTLVIVAAAAAVAVCPAAASVAAALCPAATVVAAMCAVAAASPLIGRCPQA